MDNLTDLMNRATRSLPPESPDLVERGIARGIEQRRRKVTLATATAVVATVAAVGGGHGLIGHNSTRQAPVSTNSPSPVPSAKPVAKSGEVTPAETLETLKKLLPTSMSVTQARTLGGQGSGVNQVSMIVNDGKGGSLLEVLVRRVPQQRDCAGGSGCIVRKDRSVLVARETPLFPAEPKLNPAGIVKTTVEVFRPDGTLIVLGSYNATADEGVEKTRTRPPFDPKALTAIADSKQWRFPKEAPGWNGPDPLNPGTGKPAVPATETLQMLKRSLPVGLKVTTPSTEDSDAGENNASFLVDDGKGAALVHVKVTITTRDTRCTGEWWTTCKVRDDGSRLGYLDNQKSEGDGRMSQAQLNYPDGRSITVTSFNTEKEYGRNPSRTKPVLSADQLVTIAGKPGWAFPGIPNR